MAEVIPHSSASHEPLRLWPGVALVALQLILRFVLPMVVPAALPIGVLGAVVCALLIVVWWAFFSRASRIERWGGVALMIVGLVAASQIVHESVATGMMGMMFPFYALPILSVVLVAWAVAARNLPDRPRRVSMVVAILKRVALQEGYFLMVQ